MRPIDLVVTGRMVTLAHGSGRENGGARDEGAVPAEPLGVAIAGGTIVEVGPIREIRDLAGPSTRIVEAAPDQVVIPGFTDAHLHLGEAALAAAALDLGRTRSLVEALGLIRERHEALPRGEWLMGLGWQAGVWGGWPSAQDLEDVAPGRAAFLWSYDHHAAWVSPTALTAAGITAASEDPPTGRIARDTSGTPTGILHEDAVRLAAAALPPVTTGRLAAAIERYSHTLVGMGVVAVHDPGPLVPDPSLELDMAACAALAAAGKLPLRVHVSVRADSLSTAGERGMRTGDDLLPLDAPPELRGRARVGWLKLFADGALGSRTAALLEPYRPEPTVPLPAGPRGVLTADAAELAALVEQAARYGIATQIHAIGDAAVRATLDAFEASAGAIAGLPARPRIEHAQLVAGPDLPRFGALGVVASVQPAHIGTDADGAAAAWGERAATGGYPYGDLVRAGATLVFGSDAPVEPADPWAALAFAVFRNRHAARPPLLGAHQRVTMLEALRASCAAASEIAGVPGGTITPDAPADMVVVTQDALADPLGARPVVVVSNGVVRG